MAILADQHIHSQYSFDSDEKMKTIVEHAINKGLKHICFTEHNDFDFPISEEFPEGSWLCNVDSYLYDLLSLREEYKDKIEIGFGLEIGMQESCIRDNLILSRAHEFDFLIGSVHLVDKIDPYDPAYLVSRDNKRALTDYLQTIIKNIKRFQAFDVLGHMDYVVRILPDGESNYIPLDYMDYVDEIIDILLENEKGIEVNTSQMRKEFKNPNPHYDIIKRYKEKGGEIITIGSDAHDALSLSTGFDEVEEMLKNIGFKYYSIYKDRVPTYTKL